MVKSLSSPTVNPASAEAVKPEVSASRYTYLKHNMNWTRAVLGAKDMPVYEKAARVAAAFFVALAEFFVVNGAFLIANAALFIANQAHRAFAKHQISEIELPPSPKSPKDGETSTPTIAQLPDTATPDGQYIEFRVPNLFSPEDQPLEGPQSPRAQDVAAVVADVAADALPQPDAALAVVDALPQPDAAPAVVDALPQPDAALAVVDALPQPEQLPDAAPAVVVEQPAAPVVEDDLSSVHSEPQPPAVPADKPAAVQDDAASESSTDEDLIEQAKLLSLLPPSPTASENAAAIGLFADLEDEAALLEQTLAAAQQQPALVDAETLVAALDGVAEDLDDAMLQQGIHASQENRAETRSPTPVELQVIAPLRAQSPVESEIAGEELLSSTDTSRAQTPVATLVVDEPVVVANQSPKAPSRVPTPVAALAAEQRVATPVSSKASSRAQSPVAALVVDEPVAANQSPKAASRVPTPVAVQKQPTPPASPAPMQQADKVSPRAPLTIAIPSPVAADIQAEESDDSGDELVSNPSKSASPRVNTTLEEVDGDENLLTPSPRAETPLEEVDGDRSLLTPSPQGSQTSKASSENDGVVSESASDEEYESESDDGGSNLNSPAASPKPAGMKRFWGIFSK